MEEKYLYQLAELVLPSDVLHYFSIVKIESDTSLLGNKSFQYLK